MAAYRSTISEAGLDVLNESCVETVCSVSFAPALRRTTSVAEIFERAGLLDDLRAVEQLMLARTASRSNVIAEASEHTIRAGGKRLRAAMALLAAHMGTYELDAVIHAAAAAELIHAASLIHDDLVDQTDLRRGHVTVHTRWDNDVALMTGDFFFALATAEMALSPDPRIITYYADAVQKIVAGELSPVTVVEPFETALRQYLYKTGSKTASLFEAPCKAGMAAGGGSEEQIVALGRYGYDLGLAFQIMDDVLDFVGDERTLGKPAGNDLRQGTVTLPLMYAVRDGGSPALRKIAFSSTVDEAALRAAIDEVLARGGVERTIDSARHFVEQAIAHLDIFTPSRARDALIDLAYFTVERRA
jgi:heptaprenyl diphosphate synthase/octaprenyl-diphosphate synthase